MDAKTLQERQSPLKQKYQKNPQEAVMTLEAEGKLGDNITCEVPSQHGTTVAGLHPATGGSDSVACSGDMLLQSLVACAGVTLNAVSTNMGLHLESAEIRAEGDLDFRGTLGVSKDAPVGFKEIQLHFELETDEEKSNIEKLIELTEKFCVIYQTLNDGVTIHTSHAVINSN